MSFANHLLIAMPSLTDAYFKRSVIYVCEHNAEGAMGIVINIPIDMRLSELLSQVAEDSPVDEHKKDQIIVKGGPVAPDRGFILHTPQPCWESSLQISDEFMITTSKDILSALGNELGPEQQVIALGYAGWSPDQLEQEIQDNAWLTLPATAALVFDTPLHLRWEAAVKALGIEPWQLTESAGHA